MVGVHPFVGAHVRPDFVRRVPAPAFDSMSGPQRTDYLATHPESYTLVTRSPGDGGPEDDASPDRLIELGADALDRILEAEAFIEHETPSFFLYRLTWGEHVQIGIVGQVETAAYLDGRVKRHERVSHERALHLSNHFERLGVHSSPIALGYRADPRVRAILDSILGRDEPVLSFTSGDGLEQAVWVIDSAAECSALSAAFEEHELYIMDGHHRAAAAGELAKRVGSPRGDFMLGVLFAEDRVRIDPFHRRVTMAHDADPHQIASRMIEALNLRPDPSVADIVPVEPNALGVYLAGRWWCGTLPAPLTNSPLDAIDPVLLQQQIIGPILGVDPENSANNISYFLDDADRHRIVESISDREVLFVLRPVTPAEVFAVADAGEDMPPKSTYVTPKPRSGVFLRRF